jgi:hypothetical protein
VNEPRDEQSDSQLPIIRKLMEENVSIVGDAVEIRKDRWVIHGVLPYGGEVPMAVYDTYDEAKHALDEVLGPIDHSKVTGAEDV